MKKVCYYLNSHPNPEGVVEILGTTYRITRVYNLRNSEKPEYRGSNNISFGVWIIQPTRNVFLRVELMWTYKHIKKMTTHELANILLQQEDVPVHFQYFNGGPDEYYNPTVSSVHQYNGEVYLSETDNLFPPDMRYEDCFFEEQEDEWPLYDVGPIIHPE